MTQTSTPSRTRTSTTFHELPQTSKRSTSPVHHQSQSRVCLFCLLFYLRVRVQLILTSISTGVAALVASSFQTLKLLEFTPLTDEGFSHPSSDAVHPHLHICSLIASCPRLKDLAITVPACCPEMFSRPSVAWQETARIRVAGRGNCNPAGLPLDMNIEGFIHTLESARDLVSPAARKGRGELDIEIAVGNWLFDVKTGFVHGNFLEAKKASEMLWAPEEFPTTKGPYGHTGLYGDVEDVKGEWSCVPSRDFFEAMRWGLVRFDN